MMPFTRTLSPRIEKISAIPKVLFSTLLFRDVTMLVLKRCNNVIEVKQTKINHILLLLFKVAQLRKPSVTTRRPKYSKENQQNQGEILYEGRDLQPFSCLSSVLNTHHPGLGYPVLNIFSAKSLVFKVGVLPVLESSLSDSASS